MARFIHTSLVESIARRSIYALRANGVLESLVIVKHGLCNEIIPLVTMMWLQFSFFLGSLIMVGNVFQLAVVESVAGRCSGVLLFLLEFILSNLLVAMLYTRLTQ
jgi:glutathione transport system permease protein